MADDVNCDDWVEVTVERVVTYRCKMKLPTWGEEESLQLVHASWSDVEREMELFPHDVVKFSSRVWKDEPPAASGGLGWMRGCRG